MTKWCIVQDPTTRCCWCCPCHVRHMAALFLHAPIQGHIFHAAHLRRTIAGTNLTFLAEPFRS